MSGRNKDSSFLFNTQAAFCIALIWSGESPSLLFPSPSRGVSTLLMKSLDSKHPFSLDQRSQLLLFPNLPGTFFWCTVSFFLKCVKSTTTEDKSTAREKINIIKFTHSRFILPPIPFPLKYYFVLADFGSSYEPQKKTKKIAKSSNHRFRKVIKNVGFNLDNFQN